MAASSVAAITLVVADLAVSADFYRRAFDVPIVHTDDDSTVFSFDGLLINLLRESAAPELLAPAPVGPSGAPPRAVYTVPVDDVDAYCNGLASRGVTLLNGPMTRPWGPRTASFADPDGHVWELSS